MRFNILNHLGVDHKCDGRTDRQNRCSNSAVQRPALKTLTRQRIFVTWPTQSYGLVMGVDHGGTGGHVPPEFGVGGTIMQIVSCRFCHISTKMSVLWSSKYAKIRFRPGLRPGPRWGSSRRSPRPPSRLKSGHPSPYPTPLGTNPPSALAMRPPEFQPDLRLCV